MPALALLALASPAVAAITVDPPATQASPVPPAESGQRIALERDAGDDQRIARRLNEIFANVPSLAEVQVAVGEGVVTLSGTAVDDAAIARAEAIAAGTEGVVTVENAIRRDVSVNLDGGLGGLSDRLAGFARMLPLTGAALLVALLVIGFGYLLARLTGLWRRTASNSFLAELIASAIRFAAIVLGLVLALDMVGAGTLMGAVLGGAGVIGIALGFAMRDIVENYVASLMLSLRQPFRANDLVVIDQHEGRVIRLTSRATVLMTLDGNHLRIPNSTVFKSTILNYTRNPQRRFDFTLGVDSDDDVEAARQLGRETLAALPFILAEPAPEVRIAEVGDSSVVLRFLGWIDQRESDWHKARSRAIAQVKAALEQAGFAMPEPIYRLRFDQRTASLPLENIADRKAIPAAAAPPPPPPPPPAAAATAAAAAADVAPEDEIARMVDEERASGGEQDKDLLDQQRPVE